MSDPWANSAWDESTLADDVGASVKPLIHPPVRYLVTAGVMVGLSLALLPVPRFAANVIGYLAGSLVTVALLALYTAVDQRSRLSARYSAKPDQQKIRIALAVAGIAVASLHAWFIAVHYAS